jgi:hypothetical protein
MTLRWGLVAVELEIFFEVLPRLISDVVLGRVGNFESVLEEATGDGSLLAPSLPRFMIVDGVTGVRPPN